MIYCVEDDAGIRELVVYTLRNTGFEADGFGDGAALTTALKKCIFNVENLVKNHWIRQKY